MSISDDPQEINGQPSSEEQLEEKAPGDETMMAIAANNFMAVSSSSISAVDAPVNEANLADETLVRRILAGDTDSFSELVDRYKVAVFNLCSRMLGSRDDAEDASQEVFLRAYNQLHTYQLGRRFSTWILSIASHYCTDMLRRRRPSTDLDSIAFWKASDQPEPEEFALSNETRDEVRDLLDKLDEKYRGVVVLRYWQDLSYEEIAEATNLPIATVKTRLFRARQILEKEMEIRQREGRQSEQRAIANQPSDGSPTNVRDSEVGQQNSKPKRRGLLGRRNKAKNA